MKRLNLLLIFIFSIIIVVNAQVVLFEDFLAPETPELLDELKTISGDALDEKIEELRNKAYATAAPHRHKVDLAAFLLRKLSLRRDLSFRQNEDLIYEAADLLPGNPYVESMWGDLLYFSGNYNKSLTHFENALYKKPEDMKLVAKCGLAAQQLMQYDKALRHFEKALKFNPDSFFLLFSAGRCSFELKEYEEAVQYWEKALEVVKSEKDRMAIESAIKSAKEMLASTDGSSRDENQRFVIHFAGESQNDLGDLAFDTLDDIYFDVTELLQFYPEVQINLVFFLTEEYYKINKKWSAGAARGIQIMIPLKSGYKSEDYIRGLLAHEFTHTIIHLKTNNRCPLWLNEGLAQYSEFQAAYGDAEELRYDYVPIMETEFIENQNFVKLKNVPSMMRGSSRRNISKAYIASYLAVRCLADFYGEYVFDEILTELGKGKTIDDALLNSIGRDMSDFQIEYEDWLRNL